MLHPDAVQSLVPICIAAARTVVPSRMTFRKDPPIYMGGEKVNSPEAEYAIKVASSDAVAAIIAEAQAALED